MHRAGVAAPVPLPAQAIDHAGGWLLAAGVLHALALWRDDGRGRGVRMVLARTGQWIDDLGRQEEPADAGAAAEVEVVASPLGTVTRGLPRRARRSPAALGRPARPARLRRPHVAPTRPAPLALIMHFRPITETHVIGRKCMITARPGGEGQLRGGSRRGRRGRTG